MLFSKKKSSELPRRRSQATDERRSSEETRSSRLFTRNQTLTGSLSSRISNAGEAHAHLKSSRVHAHSLAAVRRRVTGHLGLTLIVCLGLYLFIYQFIAHASIRLVGISRSNGELSRTYEPIIQDYFASRPVERLRFLTNTDTLTAFVQTKAPEVKSIEVEPTAGLGTSQFLITPRRPAAGWLLANRQQYVDDAGIAFAQNYYDTPGVQIVDSSGVPTKDGHVIASNRFLGFVGRLVGLVQQQGYTVVRITIPPDTTRLVEVGLKDIPYPIRSSVDRSAGEQAEDIGRVVHYLTKEGISPSYVDVRVKGKAYYK